MFPSPLPPPALQTTSSTEWYYNVTRWVRVPCFRKSSSCLRCWCSVLFLFFFGFILIILAHDTNKLLCFIYCFIYCFILLIYGTSSILFVYAGPLLWLALDFVSISTRGCILLVGWSVQSMRVCACVVLLYLGVYACVFLIQTTWLAWARPKVQAAPTVEQPQDLLIIGWLLSWILVCMCMDRAARSS